MKQLIKVLSLAILLFVFLPSSAQKKTAADKAVQIPFDSTTNKYTYVRIVELPEKKAADIYKTAKQWSKVKFSDDKFLIDEENVKFIDEGKFSINIVMNAGLVKSPFQYSVLYNLNVYTKDGKSKIEITNIRVTPNANGVAEEQSLESFKTQLESISLGKKIATTFVTDCFYEIDLQAKKVIDELETALKNDGTKKDDW